jgi:hypothetical protein
MKITVKTPRPRNPLVTLARSRRAGAHRPTGGSQRQRASREMQRELRHMTHSP